MTTPYMMHYDGRNTPHIVIEVNQKCNLSCRACYKNRSVYTKPLEQIKQEIDQALSLRDLDVITLAGGEPTLNDELPEVIRYAAAKGVKVNLLSNGLNLTEERLVSYRDAGLDVIHVHVDSQQHRPDVRDKNNPNRPEPNEAELNRLRQEIVTRIAKCGIHPALSMTVYKSTLDELPDVARFLFSSPETSECLVTLYADFRGISDKLAAQNPDKAIGGVETADSHPEEVVTNAEVADLIRKRFDLDYAMYVASNKNKDAKRWIIYWLFALTAPGGEYRVMSASPTFIRLLLAIDKLNRKLTGRHRFMVSPSPRQTFTAALISALTQPSLAEIGRSVRFLAASFQSGRRLHKKSLYVQELPTVADDGEIELCRSCPDATIRNGALLPLCLADIISPITDDGPRPGSDALSPAAALIRLS